MAYSTHNGTFEDNDKVTILDNPVAFVKRLKYLIAKLNAILFLISMVVATSSSISALCLIKVFPLPKAPFISKLIPSSDTPITTMIYNDTLVSTSFMTFNNRFNIPESPNG